MSGSSQLEGFRARGVEVLLLSDPIDAFWPDRMNEFEDKPIRSITQGAADLSKLEPQSAPEGDVADTTALATALKTALGDAVSEVRATDRLVESAVVLSANSSGPDLQMQRLLRRAGRPGFAAPPILEINPRHALIAALARQAAAGTDVAEQAGLLLDLARVQDGELPKDAAGFARRIERALAASMTEPSVAGERTIISES
jgi:molecular chaperone HtpG